MKRDGSPKRKQTERNARMKKRIAMSIGCLICVVASVFLSGCMTVLDGRMTEYDILARIVPESGMGLSIKTSELNKALRGKDAYVRVLIKDKTVLSNANDRTSVCLREITTGRDFACALTDAYSKILNDFVEYQAHMLEDSDSGDPVLKVSAGFKAPIVCKTGKHGETTGKSPFCFNLDSDEGGIMVDVNTSSGYFSAIKGAECILTTLKIDDGDDKISKRMHDCVGRLYKGISSRTSGELAYFVIYGDDEDPVCVVGEDIGVCCIDGNMGVHEMVELDYRHWVQKDEKVTIRGRLGGWSTHRSVHFFRKRRWWLLWLF